MDRHPEIFDNDNEDLSVLDYEDTLDYLASERFFDCQEHKSKRVDPDYKKVQPCLGYAPLEVIKKTFEKTTQFARNTVWLPFRTPFKSRFPALRIQRGLTCQPSTTVRRLHKSL